MNLWLAFTLGLLIGCAAGVLLAGLCRAAGEVKQPTRTHAYISRQDFLQDNKKHGG